MVPFIVQASKSKPQQYAFILIFDMYTIHWQGTKISLTAFKSLSLVETICIQENKDGKITVSHFN